MSVQWYLGTTCPGLERGRRLLCGRGRRKEAPGPERGRKLGFLSHLLLPSTEELRLGERVAWGRLRSSRLAPRTRESGPPARSPSDPGVQGRSPSSFGPGGPGPHPSSLRLGGLDPQPFLPRIRESGPLGGPPQPRTAAPAECLHSHTVLQLHVKKGAGLGQVCVGPGPEPLRPAAVASPLRHLSSPAGTGTSPSLPPLHPPKLAKLRKHLWHGRAGTQSDRRGALKSAGPLARRHPACGAAGRGVALGRLVCAHQRPARGQESQPSPPRLPAGDTPPSPSRPPGAAKLALQVWLRPPRPSFLQEA